MSLWVFAVTGAIGALIADMIKDGYLEMPKLEDDKFYPGFLGGLLIGACVGYFVDQTLLSAFAWGYIGKQGLDFIIRKAFPAREK